jgi:hypothetical protein
MIHSTTAPRRRIAVIRMPRPNRARMGSIGPIPAPAYGWTTISDATPDSSANWLSYVVKQQNQTALTTPGTLDYTPAALTPPAVVAPWNSWNAPNCPPLRLPAVSPAAAATVSATTPTDWPKTAALLAAAAGLVFYFGRRR